MPLVDKELPRRKPNRLKEHDYRSNGAYFITIVTKQRVEVLGKVENGIMVLSPIGESAASCIGKIEAIYPSVLLEASVVMPNHVHMLLHLLDDKKNPSIQRVVQQWKGAVSKLAGYSLWQDRYDDRLVLSAERHRVIKAYIKANPANWADDQFNPTNDTPPLAEHS